MDGVALSAVVFIALNPLIIVPLITYYTLRFYQCYGQSDLLQNRSRLVVFTQNILIVAALLLERPYSLIADVIYPDLIPRWTANLMFNLFWSFILILFSCKAFNLYFEQQF